jgi:ABC-type sugar transport system ATPase subunit
MAILIVSSDFPELVSLATRILVVHEGRVMGDIAAKDATEAVLLQMAAGHRLAVPTGSTSHAGAKL